MHNLTIVVARSDDASNRLRYFRDCSTPAAAADLRDKLEADMPSNYVYCVHHSQLADLQREAPERQVRNLFGC